MGSTTSGRKVCAKRDQRLKEQLEMSRVGGRSLFSFCLFVARHHRRSVSSCRIVTNIFGEPSQLAKSSDL
jgi:hypothetical protein